MSTVTKLTVIALARVALLAMIIALPMALLFDARAGWIAATAVAFICFAYYAYKLAQLSQWLSSQEAATLPDGIGLWGDMLGDLYRVIRGRKQETAVANDRLKRFEEAALALPDGAVMLDEQYNIVWCNPSAEKHWSISLGSDRGQTITYLIRVPEFIAYLDQRQFGEPLLLRLPGSKTQPAHEVVLSVQLVRFGADQLLLVSSDVSQRERLETMRKDFVANVSHELRTPLTVLTGFVETASAIGASNPALLEKSLGHMSAQTIRMQSLVEDLLALSRLEDSRNRLNAAPVNVPDLLNGIVADARHLSAGAHTIKTQIDTLWVTGNRDELASAFTNLVVNAVRYTPPDGEIDVKWALADDCPTFAVHDNGDGIAPEHIPRLTERFYRVDRGRSRASGGTGLGLAIVKHVLLRHGAKLDITSSQHADRHGSTFTVTFPAERQCKPAPKPESVAA